MMYFVRRLRLQLLKNPLRLCFSCRGTHGAVSDGVLDSGGLEGFWASNDDDSNRNSQQKGSFACCSRRVLFVEHQCSQDKGGLDSGFNLPRSIISVCIKN